MNKSAAQRSQSFLGIADQFKLGELVTEGAHPATHRLSETAQEDTVAALRLLFKVDADVVRKYRELAESGRMAAIADQLLHALQAGGRIFFTGCGSTGRLSILLDSIWRDFWQQQAARAGSNPLAADMEGRSFSVMAGGDFALIKAVEGFEDYTEFGRKQIGDLGVKAGDVVFAITEGGETSFVIGTAWAGVDAGAKVYFVYNNPDEVLCRHVERSRKVIEEDRIEKLNLTTGPMAISGSTRMQATTVQLCVIVTVLEMVVRQLGEGTPDAGQAAAGEFLAGLEALDRSLSSEELLQDLASLVQAETGAYRSGGKAHYHADHLAIDVLTDTTERSPTFCTPPFRKRGDRTSSESMVFLFVPGRTTPEAWRWLLKRSPRCLNWQGQDVATLVPSEQAERSARILRTITEPELMQFAIGEDGLADRSFREGDFQLTISAGQKERLPAALGAAPGHAALVFSPPVQAPPRPAPGEVRIPVPETRFLLDGLTRVAVKMVLNAISTCVMVRLGRVMGNTMIYVVPSNLKLIDRATRYISRLAGLDYPQANQLLFEALEYVEPRMVAGQEYPPVVGLAVLHVSKRLSYEEAEATLRKGFSPF
jgi:N-acetylmuramic acid 6-phosphate etherase